MKRIATLFLVLGIIAVATPALAATTPVTQCQVPPDHGIYDEYNLLVGCIKSLAWDEAMAAQQHGTVLPVFIYPQTVSDQYGVIYECSQFLMKGCVDATKTPEYRTYMQTLARQLIANGTAGAFPVFAGWVGSVR